MITGFLVAINRSPLVSCWSFTPCHQPANKVICQMKAEESKPGKINAAKGSSWPKATGAQQGKTRPFLTGEVFPKKIYSKFSGQKVLYQQNPLDFRFHDPLRKFTSQKKMGIRQEVSFTLARTPLQLSVGPLNKWLGVGLFSYDCFGNDATCSHTIKAK